jgi:protein arginine kinase activator
MLCQSCNQRDANVHITKVINGVKNEFHLCEECAKQKQEINMGIPFNMSSSLSFQNIMDGFVEMMGNSTPPQQEQKKCETCGMTFDHFRRTGKVGCGGCYEAFGKNLTPLIKRIHGNLQHTGKLPKRTGGLLKLKRSVDNLKSELKMAINNEEYERAAMVRDQIREIESKIREQGSRG